jgi:hypothetical protein
MAGPSLELFMPMVDEDEKNEVKDEVKDDGEE